MLGFEDEVWWSRLAQPHLHAWSDGKQPLRLVAKSTDAADPEPKAIACYGLLRNDTGGVLLRFVAGRPVSHVTIQFLQWLVEELAREGKKALLLVWDNARWHNSREVREWVQRHNRHTRKEGGVRLLVCPLPSKSPWLNPIEPKWVHGKRAVAEPGRKLSVAEMTERLCSYYHCDLLEPLVQNDK